MDGAQDSRFDDRDLDRGGRGYPTSNRGGYRGGRSPGRHHNYRGPRSPRRSPPRRSPPPRRGRTPPPHGNKPPVREGHFDDRPRSRSPPLRRSRSPGPIQERGDRPYRPRPRSPAMERQRSPIPYGRTQSPYEEPPYEQTPPYPDRERSPPGNYRQYSPPPKHAGRYADGPEDEYERRDTQPPREEYKRFSREGAYRSRGRSRSPRVSSHPSRGDTPNSSRRSSPRSYGDRSRIDKQSSGYGSRYDQNADRPSPRYLQRDRSPPRRGYSPRRGSRSPPRRGYSPPPKSPRDTTTGWSRGRDAPPPRRETEFPSRDREYTARSRESPYVGPTSRTWRKPEGSGPAPRDDFPSPGGPQNESRDAGPRRSPPSGPPGHRPDMLSAPTQPRGGRGGGVPPYGREPRDREFQDSRESRDGPPFGGGRGGRGGFSGPSTPRGGPMGYETRAGPGQRAPSHNDGYGPPSRSPPPRDYGSGAGPPRERDREPRGPVERSDFRDHGPPHRPPPFRSNNSSSTTYPQTRFFNNAGPRKGSSNAAGTASGGGGWGAAGNGGALSNLEKLVEGGKKAPSALDPAQEKRLQQLEDERKKLLEQIEEKQRAKRQSLRDWENAEREAKRDGLKSELAEGHLERLGGEGGGGGAY